MNLRRSQLYLVKDSRPLFSEDVVRDIPNYVCLKGSRDLESFRIFLCLGSVG